MLVTTVTAGAQDCPPGETCEQQISETQMFSDGPQQPGALMGDAFFTRFNTNGGLRQLTSVTVTTRVTVDYTAFLENLFLGGGQTITVTGSPAASVEDIVSVNGLPHHELDLDPMNPGNNVSVMVAVQESEDFPAFDGVDDSDGPSGETIMGSESMITVANLTDPMDLARFTVGSGSGPVGPVQLRYTTLPSMPMCAAMFDAGCDLLTEATVEITVAYNFCMCTPTPDCKCINRRKPGSLLLYPEYDNRGGHITVFTVTNTNCSFLEGETDVEFVYRNETDCSEANVKVDLTPCDTFTFLTTTHNGYQRGYAYAFARDSNGGTMANPAGTPIVFNHLIGQSLVVNGFKSLEYSINAVSFRAFGEEGESTDREDPGPFPGVVGDGIRDLDGFEYDEAPDEIYIPRFLGQDDVLDKRGLHSELILIALSGGRQFVSSPFNVAGGTTVFMDIYNDNEEPESLEHTFDCWQKLRLGFLQSVDLETPIPGTMLFDNDTLQASMNAPDEILGGMGLESGWFKIDGLVANSTQESILDPAIYAVLIETVRGKSAGDLPFEWCSQINGDLLPNNIRGDFNRLATPPINDSDNQ